MNKTISMMIHTAAESERYDNMLKLADLEYKIPILKKMKPLSY